MQHGETASEKSGSSLNVKHRVSIKSSNSTPSYTSKKNKHIHTHVHTHRHTQTWKLVHG